MDGLPYIKAVLAAISTIGASHAFKNVRNADSKTFGYGHRDRLSRVLVPRVCAGCWVRECPKTGHLHTRVSALPSYLESALRFAFLPLMRLGSLASLGHWHGWISAYGLATSNLDIWLLSLLKFITITVLIHLAPKKVDTMKDDAGSVALHKRVSIRLYSCMSIAFNQTFPISHCAEWAHHFLS